MAYPLVPVQYTNQLALQNPAFLVAYNKAEASLTSRRNLGFWRNNQTYFASGGVRVSNGENFHGLGLGLYYDKEGTYLKRYRGYGQYAYHVALNKRWSVSAGLSLGIMSYQVGNADYDGGTANTYDGTFGLLLYSPDFYLSASINQLPQSQVQPIYEITVLERYYQLMCGKDFELGEKLLGKTGLSTRLFPNRSADLYLQTGLVWDQLLGLYGIYKWNKQLGLMVGFEKIEWAGTQFKTYFSYDIATNGLQRYHAFEITLQFIVPEGERNKMSSKGKKKRK